MKAVQKTIISVLILLALALGFFLLKSKTSRKQSADNGAQNSQTEVVYQNASPSKISLDDLRKIISSSLVANPSADLIKQYSVSVANAAVDSSVLDVSGCTVTPNVLHLKMNQSFTLQNKDTVSHQINYAQTSADAAAQSQKQTTLNFQSPGNYPFRCDQSTQFMGVFLVTP